jgi:hypothetical protein
MHQASLHGLPPSHVAGHVTRIDGTCWSNQAAGARDSPAVFVCGRRAELRELSALLYRLRKNQSLACTALKAGMTEFGTFQSVARVANRHVSACGQGRKPTQLRSHHG